MHVQVFLALTAVMSIFTFCLFGIDKRRARRGMWRVPERTLLAACALLGAAGGLTGMRAFHHKTRKPRFRYGVPALLALQVALLAALALR